APCLARAEEAPARAAAGPGPPGAWTVTSWHEGGSMQVPAYVEYEKATSIEDAIALLARFGPEARILAGGHSLIPMMKLRLAQPETLIDINGLGELCYLTEADGELRIGTLTRHAQLLDSPVAGRYFAI